MTQHSPAEMREVADFVEAYGDTRELLGHHEIAAQLHNAASMLRQAADAFDAAEKATRAFTDQDLATFAAMQVKD